MSEYRRWSTPGGTFFFTVVTHHRASTFRDPDAVRLLGVVMRRVREKLPFQTPAIVVLPDHLHCIWSLPHGDSNYSGRWRWIKGAFTEQWLNSGRTSGAPSTSRSNKGEHGVWQRRFWEHWIRDEEDLERHVDYIHYNPVRHGYVRRPIDWPWSSFSRHLALGQYPEDWGRIEPVMPCSTPPE